MSWTSRVHCWNKAFSPVTGSLKLSCFCAGRYRNFSLITYYCRLIYVRFGKQETLNFYLFSDQILVGKLGGRRDSAQFSRIDLHLIHVHGNYGTTDGVPRPPTLARRSRGFSSASKSSKSDSFADDDLDYDSDCSASADKKTYSNTIVFQSPRESFLIFAR